MQSLTIEDLIKAITTPQPEDQTLPAYAEALLRVLDNAEQAGSCAGIRVAHIDALQAMQIGIAAIIDAAALTQDEKD